MFFMRIKCKHLTARNAIVRQQRQRSGEAKILRTKILRNAIHTTRGRVDMLRATFTTLSALSEWQSIKVVVKFGTG